MKTLEERGLGAGRKLVAYSRRPSPSEIDLTEPLRPAREDSEDSPVLKPVLSVLSEDSPVLKKPGADASPKDRAAYKIEWQRRKRLEAAAAALASVVSTAALGRKKRGSAPKGGRK